MSRSKKREPVYKDPNNTKGKKLANKKFRRKVKEMIHNETDNMPLIDEVMNAYDIIDFKFRIRPNNKKEYDKVRRK